MLEQLTWLTIGDVIIINENEGTGEVLVHNYY